MRGTGFAFPTHVQRVHLLSFSTDAFTEIEAIPNMKMIPLLVLALGLWGTPPESKAQKTASESEDNFVLVSKIDWGALNPARGALGPRAANLWGDRTGKGASGFLVKFIDGFESPPHIHNITYRGVVISGEVHNDDPAAAPMWMTSGSYWTQPAGEVHITAAKGRFNLVYVEIQQGPYLVQPAEEANDNGERPVNVDASNIVWLDASATTWIDGDSDAAAKPQLAFLWGEPSDNKPIGTLIRLPPGYSGTIRSDGSTNRAVVIQGQPQVRLTGQSNAKLLDPGSYFGSEIKAEVNVSPEAESPCIIYVRSTGKFVVTTKR